MTRTDAPIFAIMLALGFSAGLPSLLIASTQAAWLKESGVSIPDIGHMSYCTLPFALKFLWAPCIDSFDIPRLSRILGRQRAWMLLSQMGIALGLLGLAFSNPAHGLMTNILFASLTALASATQDITIDAWRIGAACLEKQGVMTTLYRIGYHGALLCAGAGALYLASHTSWSRVYLIMLGLSGVGMITCLMMPRPETTRRAAVNLRTAYEQPLRDFYVRHGKWLAVVLLLVTLYRLPDFLSGVMSMPFYIEQGFSKTQIATVTKLYGMWIGLAGALTGGWFSSRWGLMPTLLIGGLAASTSHLSLSLLAHHPKQIEWLIFSVSVENFASGFAGIVFVAYLSSLVSPSFAATQYALLSSLYALLGKAIAGKSGDLVSYFGYSQFFAQTAMIGLPVGVIVLLVWYKQRRNVA